jgi:hypothetical protein
MIGHFELYTAAVAAMVATPASSEHAAVSADCSSTTVLGASIYDTYLTRSIAPHQSPSAHWVLCAFFFPSIGTMRPWCNNIKDFNQVAINNINTTAECAAACCAHAQSNPYADDACTAGGSLRSFSSRPKLLC